MIDRCERGKGLVVVDAALDGDTTLSDGRYEFVDGEHLGDPVGQPEDLECGDRHDDRTVVGNLRESGADVAAQFDELEVGTHPLQLGTTADRAGGDGRATRQRVERSPHERVAGIAALRECTDRQAVGGEGRQILGRVRSDVGPPVEYGCLDLLDEHPLSADRVERYVRPRIARRLNEDQLDVAAGRPPDRIGDRGGLCSRLRGTPGRESESAHRALSRCRTDRAPRRRCAHPGVFPPVTADARRVREATWR